VHAVSISGSHPVPVIIPYQFHHHIQETWHDILQYILQQQDIGCFSGHQPDKKHKEFYKTPMDCYECRLYWSFCLWLSVALISNSMAVATFTCRAIFPYKPYQDLTLNKTLSYKWLLLMILTWKGWYKE